MKESELYPHIKRYFTEQDYDVKAEVTDIDVMAVKDETIVIVEMKTSLNLQLLGQAVERQALFDIVYIAVPKPKYKKEISSQYRRTLRLVKRLRLGLLYVDMRGEGACVEVFSPKVDVGGTTKSRKERLTRKVIKEFKGLSGDYNIGGTNKRKKMTAYKERALAAAMYLEKYGQTKASVIKNFGCGENVRQIMYGNHYGWFSMLGNGVYDITEEGKRALTEHKKICDVLEKTVFADDKKE